MRLENNYYQIVGQHEVKGHGVFLIKLLDDCRVYKGHFPGNPVCPGVFNIQTIKECAEQMAGKHLHIVSIRQCRLKAVATPTECPRLYVAVELSPVEAGFTVKASISDDDRVYMEYQGEMRA